MDYFALGYTAVNIQATNPDKQTGWYLLFAAWALVTTATLASLFFSEVMNVPVCVLCWYQRIAMYPLVIILAVGLFPFDPRVVRYASGLAGLGLLIALFQLLLIMGIIPENAQPCVQGVPCTETHLSLFGFLNIPSLSLLTFTLLGVLLFYTHKMENK